LQQIWLRLLMILWISIHWLANACKFTFIASKWILFTVMNRLICFTVYWLNWSFKIEYALLWCHHFVKSIVKSICLLLRLLLLLLWLKVTLRWWWLLLHVCAVPDAHIQPVASAFIHDLPGFIEILVYVWIVDIHEAVLLL
jgi:hypothetical protein